MTDTMTPDLWRAPDGTEAKLEPTGAPEAFEWYAEAPGQRPPQFYDMTELDTGVVIRSFVVFPVEPWSPYDAASDKLRDTGWVRITVDPEHETCEHGLNADLCYGPQHYPFDEDF